MLRLIRDLFHFEFPEDGGGGVTTTASLGYEGGPAPEPAPEPAPAEWEGPSQEEWQQTQAALNYFNQQLQPSEPAAPEGGQYPQIDPFADNFGEQLSQFMQQQFQQHLSPFQEWVQHQQLGEAENRALDILDDIVSRDGEFVQQEQAYEAARALANVFLPEESQRHGFGPQAAEAALQRAATSMRSYEKAVGEAAVAKYQNQISTLSGAPHQPGTSYSAGQQQRTVPNYREGGSVSNNIFGSG